MILSKLKLWAGAALAALLLGLFATITILNKKIESLESSIAEKDQLIGMKEQAIDQYHQDLIELENENQAIALKMANANQALADNRKAQQQLASANTSLKNRIGVLKRENESIKQQLSTAIDYSIIGLFRKQPNANHYYDENGICHTTGSVNNGNACPIYTAESLVNYALDLEKALDSCNADKASIRQWVQNIKNESNDRKNEA